MSGTAAAAAAAAAAARGQSLALLLCYGQATDMHQYQSNFQLRRGLLETAADCERKSSRHKRVTNGASVRERLTIQGM
jgi:hypothetical protein